MPKDLSGTTPEPLFSKLQTLEAVPAKFLNTALEGMWLNRNKYLLHLHETRQRIIDEEYRIALNACPFYLGQRLWREDGFAERHRVFVCEISFEVESPYYSFWVRKEPKEGKGLKLTTNQKLPGHLAHLSGIENTFVEELPAYEERLRRLVEQGYVAIAPKGSSIDTPDILRYVHEQSRSNALVNIKPSKREEWFKAIFSLRNDSHLK